MRNISLHIIFFLSINLCQSQVGINTKVPLGIFHFDGKGDNQTAPTNAQVANDLIVTSDGYVGIGTINPGVKLEINTRGLKSGLKLVDGNEGESRALMSDAQGVGTWRNVKQTALEWNANREFLIPHTGLYLITLYLDDNNTTNTFTNRWVNPSLISNAHNAISLWSVTRGVVLMSSSNSANTYGVSCSGTILLSAGEVLVPKDLAWIYPLSVPILGVEIIAL